MAKPALSVMPVAIGAFAIVAFLLLVDLSIETFSTQTNTVEQAANKNSDDVFCAADAKLCPDGSSVGRSGPNCEFNACPAPTSNENSNTNASVDTGYTAPVGPFTVANTRFLNTSYRRSNDRLVLRLAKIDVSTNKEVAQGVLRYLDVQAAADFEFIPDSIRQVTFGTDGDSVIFVASESKTPAVGIFRTSISDPKKIEVIVLYNQDNLYNDDLPNIGQVTFNAATNTVAYTIAGQVNTVSNDLLVVSVEEKKPRRLKQYQDLPQIVGFPNNGAELEILWENDLEKTTAAAGVWSYDRLRVSDGRLLETVKIADESAFERHLYLNGDSISPNNLVVGFTRYNDASNKETLRLIELKTGKITEITSLPYLSGPVVWSPDSGKVLVGGSNKGIIYDLSKGVQANISDFSSAILWYPGKYILYNDNQCTPYSYDVNTKKTVKLTSMEKTCGGDYGYGYGDGYSSQPSRRWVNR